MAKILRIAAISILLFVPVVVSAQVPIDEISPAKITDLSFATLCSESSCQLTWTAPGDDGIIGTASEYDIRFSTSNINGITFFFATQVSGEPDPEVAGTTQEMTITGLEPATKYYFAIRTADEVSNWSRISNVINSITLDEIDIRPPEDITDLNVVSCSNNSCVLGFTAPGDDGVDGLAAEYDIRYSNSDIITEEEFANATQYNGEPTPAGGGSAELIEIDGLSSATTYYFAIKAADEVPNWSGISNSDSGTTLDIADDIPPENISDLSISSCDENSCVLNFTAPGDDADSGSASEYDIRFSTSDIVNEDDFNNANEYSGEPQPLIAGSSESIAIDGLLPSTQYYFAIKVADEVPNWSGISNIASSTTLDKPDEIPPADIADLNISSCSEISCTLIFTSPGDDEDIGTASEYDVRYSSSDIVNEDDFNNANQLSGEPAPQAAGNSESIVVNGLASDTTYYFAIKTADEVPNWSGISNIDSATTLEQNDTDQEPPVLSNGVPTDILAEGTTAVSIALNTNEPALCKYSLNENTEYDHMENDFLNTGATYHSTVVRDLSNGNTYIYSVRCQDLEGNANIDDFIITFTVAGNGVEVDINTQTDDFDPEGILFTVTGGCGFVDANIRNEKTRASYLILLFLIVSFTFISLRRVNT